MKKTLILVAVIALCLAMVAGCSQSPKVVTETTTVLYVEQSGFIANVAGHVCYVQCVNTDKIVAVGNQIELTYNETDHLSSDSNQSRGGYTWDTMLVTFSNLVVK